MVSVWDPFFFFSTKGEVETGNETGIETETGAETGTHTENETETGTETEAETGFATGTATVLLVSISIWVTFFKGPLQEGNPDWDWD